MTTKENKAARVTELGSHPRDTGSTDVQVALLTDRISELTEHLKVHAKDNATRRGLLKLVGQRNRLLRYLQQNDAGRYAALCEKLGIRGVKTGV